MSFYIYKYVNNNIIEYIGQTTNLEKRIEQHKKDKLKNFKGKIYYFECPNKTAMNSWEYCLINKYHPKYNAALKDNQTNININEPEWKLYMDTTDKIINILDFIDTSKNKKTVKTSTVNTIRPRYNPNTTTIISNKPAIRFTCKYCKTTFETTEWLLTKGRHHSAKCPCCPYTAWAK